MGQHLTLSFALFPLSLSLPLPVFFCQTQQTLFQTKKQLNRASSAAFSSSTYTCSPTVLYTSSSFCILFLPLLFLCSVLQPVLLLYRDSHHLLLCFPPSSSSSLLFLQCSALFILCLSSVMTPLLQSSIHHLLVVLLLIWPLQYSFPSLHHHRALLLYSAEHLLVHLHSVHLLLHSSSETHATAADRCAFHTLFVSLFCHSTKLQRSSLITPVPLTACFCVFRLMFPPGCWQRCQAQGLQCTERWRSQISPDIQEAKPRQQAAHSNTKAKWALRILKYISRKVHNELENMYHVGV